MDVTKLDYYRDYLDAAQLSRRKIIKFPRRKFTEGVLKHAVADFSRHADAVAPCTYVMLMDWPVSAYGRAGPTTPQWSDVALTAMLFRPALNAYFMAMGRSSGGRISFRWRYMPSTALRQYAEYQTYSSRFCRNAFLRSARAA